MSSTDPQDTPATAPPSTELEVKVDWLRSQLETVKAEAQRSAELAVRRDVGPLDEWVRVLADYDMFAKAICRTEFVPESFRGKPESTTAAMMYGREVGLPPMTTLQNLYVVNGKVGMYAEQLRAMILAAGHEFTIDEMNSHLCTMSARRVGSDRWSKFTYTMEMAKLTKVWGKNPNYQERPVEMMFARCTGLMAHAMFPDVIRGMGSIEELEDLGDQGEAVPVQGTPETRPTVGRAKKKADPKPVRLAIDATDPSPKPEVVIPDETLPPLPGEVEAPPAGAGSESPAGSTPGEGRTAEPSTPAGPTDDAGGAPPVDASPDPANSTPPASPRLGERHCPVFDPHSAHVWTDSDEGLDWTCIGVVPATDTGAGPVQDRPRSIASGTLRLLQAAFKRLGYTDEPDDREARLQVAAVVGDVPGAELDSFKDLTQLQAEQILRVLGPLRDRGDVLELMVRASKPEDGA